MSIAVFIIRIIGLFAASFYSYYMFYILPKKIETKKFIIYSFVLAYLSPIAYMLSLFAVLFLLRIIDIRPTHNIMQPLQDIMLTLAVGPFTAFGAAIFSTMQNKIIDFHTKYNAQNLNRNPIKFFITHTPKITTAVKTIMFIGSLYMILGALFLQYI